MRGSGTHDEFGRHDDRLVGDLAVDAAHQHFHRRAADGGKVLTDGRQRWRDPSKNAW